MPPDSFPLTSEDATPRLQLPYLAAGQAQKHVTVNEALSALDGLIQTAVESATPSAEPAAPADGALYILPADRTGPHWSLHAPGSLMRFDQGSWTPLAAVDGALAYVRDQGALRARVAGAWTPLSGVVGELQNLPRLGLGAAADAENPLAARINKALFTARPAGEGGDGDLRLTFNKEGPLDVLSLLFQSGYAGRAELGLIGDDDLQLKVSADGAAWREALRVERATGRLWAGDLALERSLAPNFLPDSGRFITGPTFTGATFAQPGYMLATGGAALSAHARFIHNNTDEGGTAGLLDPDVKALVELLRPTVQRRYGPEWWVAKLVRGTGGGVPITLGGESYDTLLNAPLAQIPRRLTVGYYLKAKAGKAAVLTTADGIRIEDTRLGADAPPQVIAPADGWRYVERLARANAYGYEQDIWGLRATAGAELLIAMPRAVLGHVRLDRLGGVLPNDRVFG